MARQQTPAPPGPPLHRGPMGRVRAGYRLVAELIERLDGAPSAVTVTDVGAEESPLPELLPDAQVNVLDLDAARIALGPEDQGDLALPLEDDCCDYAITVDALQDLEAHNRGRLLSELRRVARRGVIVAAPFDSPGVRAAEGAMNQVGRILQGEEEAPSTVERPRVEEVRQFFEDRGDTVTVLGDGRLSLWLATACVGHYENELDPQLRELAEQLETILGTSTQLHNGSADSYRHVVVALGDSSRQALAELVGESRGSERPTLDASAIGILSMVLPLAELQALRRRLDERERRLARVQAALARREAQVGDLSRRLGEAIGIATAERESRRKMSRHVDRVVDTRAWRAITLQYRVRTGVSRAIRSALRRVGAALRAIGRPIAQPIHRLRRR